MYDWCAPMKNIIKTVKEIIILIFGSIINCIVQFYKKMSGHRDETSGTDEDWEIRTMTFSSKKNKSKNEREKGNVRNRQNESKNRSQSRKTHSRGSNNDHSKSYEKQIYRQEGENRATRRANDFKQEKKEPEKTHSEGTNHVEEENWDFDEIVNNVKLVRSTVSKLDTVESVESEKKNKKHSRNREGSKTTNIEPEEVTQTNEKKDVDNSKMEEKAETSAKRNKKSSRKKNILESVNIETEKIVQECKGNHTKKKKNSKHDNKTELYRKGKDLSFKSDGESSSLDEKEKSFEDTNKSETEEPPPVKENSDAPVKENSDWANISLSDIPEFVPGSFQTVKQTEVAVDAKFTTATITKTDTNYPNNWVDVKNEKQGTIQIENNYEPATIQTEDNGKRTRSGKRNGDRQIYDAYKKHIDRKFYKNQDQNENKKTEREKSSSSFNRPRYDSKERNKIYRSRPQENDNTKTRNNSDWPLEKQKYSETKTSRKDNSIVFEAQSYQNLSDKNVKAKPLDKSTTPLDEQGKWNLEKQYKKSTTADTNYKNTPNIKPYYQNEEQETTSDWYLESINSDKDNPNHDKDNKTRSNTEEPKYESELPLERQVNTTDKNWDSDAKNSYYDDGFKSPKYSRKNRNDSYQKDRRSDKYADNYSNNSWRDKSGRSDGENLNRQDNWSKNRDRHSDRGYTGNFANTSYENRQRRRSFGSFKPPYNSWRWEDDVFSNGYSFKQFKDNIDIGSYKFTKIHEENKNLFDTDEEFALAHCVAEDMNMGSGIAVEFRKKFGEVEKLLDQRKKSGELALLTDACRPKEKKRAFVYYLVTKVFSSGKPTYESFVSSVEKMREHIRENNVKKLSIPRLGCGLDRLEWDTVKLLMEFLFFDDDIEILVCNWTPPESSTPQKKINCIVTDYLNPISNIDPQTIIILPTSEDKEESKEMKDLDDKFHFLPQFRYENVQSGNIVQYIKNEYAIFVCIVKKNKLDRFNFVSFGQCLRKIKNFKHKSVKDYYYVGFQAIEDPHDEFINAKIINLLRNIFDGKEIYYCWPPTMKNDPTYKNREDLQSSRESSYNKDF